MLAVILLGVVLYYMNKQAPAGVSSEEPDEVLDTLDVSRYRAETGVDTTINE